MTTMHKTAHNTGTQFAASADGTRIAYEATGAGPALVYVDGALCSRAMGPARKLAEALAGAFTVHVYDRRGRGESDAGATPFALEREIEDLAAVIDVAGGCAHVVAASSGAALALDAAQADVGVDRLVLYEAPFILDDTTAPNDADLPARLRSLAAEERRGEAVRLFMRTVGVPAPMVALMRLMPVWRKLTAVAHTLPYDLELIIEHQQGHPLADGRYAGVDADTLVLAGGRSPEHMRAAAAAIAAAVPSGRAQTLAGQTHMLKAKVVAPVVTRHFES